MAQPLRVITFTTDAATVIALQRGSFAAEGLKVELTVTPDSTTQMRGLSAGTWDIASTAFDNVLAWSGREGAEIVTMAQPKDEIILPMIVRPEIRDWNDLRGRRLAADAVDTAYALVLRSILLAHGLDLKRGDYELVAKGAWRQRLESMIRGETFAAIINVPGDFQAVAAGMVRFADQREVLPSYQGTVWAVTRAWGQSHRDELVNFLRIWLKSVRWTNDPANREEAIRLIAEGLGVNPSGATTLLEEVSANGALNLAGIKSVLGLRVQFDLTPPMGPDIERYYDLSYYQAALGR